MRFKFGAVLNYFLSGYLSQGTPTPSAKAFGQNGVVFQKKGSLRMFDTLKLDSSDNP